MEHLISCLAAHVRSKIYVALSTQCSECVCRGQGFYVVNLRRATHPVSDLVCSKGVDALRMPLEFSYLKPLSSCRSAFEHYFDVNQGSHERRSFACGLMSALRDTSPFGKGRIDKFMSATPCAHRSGGITL